MGRDYLVLAAVTAMIGAAFATIGLQATHSASYNFIWTAQFAEALGRGEIYPRWLPSSFEGLGSPTFYFYPPLAFYVSGLFDLAGLSTVRAVEVAAALFTLGAGVSMYVWLRSHGGRALLGASLYMLVPYHLLDMLGRGALAEHAAFVWLPLIALAIEQSPRRGTVLLAVAYAGLIMTHLPVALLATAFLVVPLAVRRSLADRMACLPLGVGLVAGVGLAAVYLFPALTLQAHISTELLWSSYYTPRSWLLIGGNGELSLNHFSVTLLFAGLAAPLLAAFAWAGSPQSRWWAALALGAVAVAVGIVPFIWDLPLMQKVQFPWRLLCVAEFAALTAVGLSPPGRVRGAMLVTVLLPGVVMVLAFATQQARRPHPLLSDTAWLMRTMPDAPEYLPKGLDRRGVADRQRIPDLSSYRALPRGAVISVDGAGEVTLGRSAFPIWRVTRDGATIATHGPLLGFNATPGTYRIERTMVWQERLGWALTLVTALGLAGWRGWHQRRRGAVLPGSGIGPCSATTSG